MNQRVNTHELAGAIEDDALDADTMFAANDDLDVMIAAMRDPKRYTRSGSQAALNKFAKVLEIVAAELVQRDQALRAAYAKLKDAEECDIFMDTIVTTTKSLRGATFEVSRPSKPAPVARKGWFR